MGNSSDKRDATREVSGRKLAIRLIACLLVSAACIVPILIAANSMSDETPRGAMPEAQTPEAEPSPPPGLTNQALEAVRPILEKEGKIAAIKAYRERTGVGLREAKEAVDSLDD